MLSITSRLVCLILMTVCVAAHAAPAVHAGRGIYHFASQSSCPFTNSAAKECNRIALDLPDVHASVDTDAHEIVFSSAANHPASAVLGDVLLQGTGIAADGRRVPLSVQVLLHRAGEDWKRDVYVHAPVRGEFTDVRIDPYRIRVTTRGAERDLMTPAETLALFSHPSLAARLGRHLVKVSATDPQRQGMEDITIALGIGDLTQSVARARFTSDAAPGIDIDPMLASGTWSIQVDVLSDHVPVWVAQRELFLFGLEGSPLVAALRTRGFRKHDSIELGMHEGNGYLRVNGQEAAFAGASASGHAFLQESFMGLILGWQRASVVAGGAVKSVLPQGRPA